MTHIETPVLVVGAGPVGMTAALLLSRLGIPSRIVERRAAPQSAPAARVVNARTFEIFRAAGVDMQAITAACQDPADAGQVRWVTTLAGQELGRLPYERQSDDTLAYTPTPLRNLSQHRLEPILLDEVRRQTNIEIAHGHEWEGAEQDNTGVRSSLRDHARGTLYEVRSRLGSSTSRVPSPTTTTRSRPMKARYATMCQPRCPARASRTPG